MFSLSTVLRHWLAVTTTCHPHFIVLRFKHWDPIAWIRRQAISKSVSTLCCSCNAIAWDLRGQPWATWKPLSYWKILLFLLPFLLHVLFFHFAYSCSSFLLNFSSVLCSHFCLVSLPQSQVFQDECCWSWSNASTGATSMPRDWPSVT